MKPILECDYSAIENMVIAHMQSDNINMQNLPKHIGIDFADGEDMTIECDYNPCLREFSIRRIA